METLGTVMLRVTQIGRPMHGGEQGSVCLEWLPIHLTSPSELNKNIPSEPKSTAEEEAMPMPNEQFVLAPTAPVPCDE